MHRLRGTMLGATWHHRHPQLAILLERWNTVSVKSMDAGADCLGFPVPSLPLASGVVLTHSLDLYASVLPSFKWE